VSRFYFYSFVTQKTNIHFFLVSQDEGIGIRNKDGERKKKPRLDGRIRSFIDKVIAILSTKALAAVIRPLKKYRKGFITWF